MRTLSARRVVGLALSLSAIVLPGCGFGGKGVTPIRTPFNKGVYQYSRGRFDEAIAEFRLALEEDASDHRARFNLAAALEAKAHRLADRGDRAAADPLAAEAEAQYRRILEARPDDLRASVNLAAREFERGDRDGAIERLRALAEKHRDSALPRAALAAHLLREARAAPGRRDLLESARTALDSALKNDPANVEANMLLGDACALLGDRKCARAAYAKALGREPSDIATLLALGRLDEAEGDRAAAVSSYRRALAIDPDHPGAHAALSGLLEAEGDLEGAVYHLWRARDLDPTAARASGDETRRRLLDLYGRLAAEEGKGPQP